MTRTELLAEIARLKAELADCRAFQSKGGAVRGPSKRRAVDYAALGRKGGLAKKTPR